MADERKRRGWRTGLEVLAVLVALYFLSWGPLIWLAWRGYTDTWQPWQIEAANAYLAPMVWIWETVPGAEKAFGWYLGLWIDPDDLDLGNK